MTTAAHGAKSQAVHEFLSTNPNATAHEIVAGLKETGVDVSFGLAKAIKYGGKRKAKGAKSRRKRAAANGPAPKAAITGTQSIQDFMRRHPGAGTKEIQMGLKTEGIRVSESLVKAVKYRKARKSARPSVRAAARKTRGRKVPRSAAISVPQLIEVNRLANALGGAQQLRRALEALEQLR